LYVKSGDLIRTADATTLTLGLADAGTAGDYGSEAKSLKITVDDKGRVTATVEYELNTDNVIEGLMNLFFTELRAREAFVPSPRISIDTGTGAIDTVGFSGSGLYTTFTFENGICTAAS